jgi:hypothetical protein
MFMFTCGLGSRAVVLLLRRIVHSWGLAQPSAAHAVHSALCGAQRGIQQRLLRASVAATCDDKFGW